MTIKVDKNVPLPPPAAQRVKYPLGDLQPGDSFFVPGKRSNHMGPVLARRRRAGWKLTVRNVTEDGVDGVRVWRLA